MDKMMWLVHILIALFLFPSRSSSKRMLALFRPRSRHTKTFLPLHKFSLSHYEYRALSELEEGANEKW